MKSAKGHELDSVLSLLHPVDARRLRAQAWRHVRRLNPALARRLKREVDFGNSRA
jgi:hypothetical protein